MIPGSVIEATILPISPQLLKSEERYISVKPLYLMTVTSAKCMKLFLPLFLNMHPMYLGYLLLYCSPYRIGPDRRQGIQAESQGWLKTWSLHMGAKPRIGYSRERDMRIVLPNRFEIRMSVER